jgi:hypothetical protein
VVQLAPGHRFHLSYCAAAEEKARCAVGSACTTIYRAWGILKLNKKK